MEIVRADIMGFCSGVRRAVESAKTALDENDKSKKGKVYTFGPLIHNPTVLDKFAERGLCVLSENNLDCLKSGDTVLIRAHGVPPKTENLLKEKGCNVINATCPLVTKSQKKAAEYASKNYNIIFAGDKNHGEVIGIEGFALESYEKNGFKPSFLLINSVDELERLFINKKIDTSKKTVLFSQTTFSVSIFNSITKALQAKIPEAEIVSSICPATHERQSSLEKLCSKVDGVLVIGGKSSANSNRLFATAQKFCKKSAFIETKDDIPSDFYDLGVVGITAGASTPDEVILEVENKLKLNLK